MTKAEQRALEKYPANKTVFDKYEKQRYAFICGYIQAEKDLELNWKDIKILRRLISTKEINDGLFDKEDYEEILKHFKEKRNDTR